MPGPESIRRLDAPALLYILTVCTAPPKGSDRSPRRGATRRRRGHARRSRAAARSGRSSTATRAADGRELRRRLGHARPGWRARSASARDRRSSRSGSSRSSPTTIRPTSRSTSRSIPTAAASTAASTASRGRRTATSAFRPGSTSRPGSSPRSMPPSGCARRSRRRPIGRAPINIGSATDAYQPVERKLGITRSVIEVLAECAHPFSLVTKSSGIERDLDLVAPMAARAWSPSTSR